ncbi:hypothetical protein MKW94_008628 [Papaver nudicaule]|uniref:Large ribosomal subunit protein eL24-related N-terminal domain-containing protein n=1 Tax=Papaver nudicaule TaxID=74823 RepID=A0AA41V112_PAPNU|nr:hypothetical protein [Papaver nudicaule]
MLLTELCRFSDAKIYPGRGIRFIRSDSQVFLFVYSKCKRYFHNNLKPSKLTWTAMYRKQHKKCSLPLRVVIFPKMSSHSCVMDITTANTLKGKYVTKMILYWLVCWQGRLSCGIHEEGDAMFFTLVSLMGNIFPSSIKTI